MGCRWPAKTFAEATGVGPMGGRIPRNPASRWHSRTARRSPPSSGADFLRPGLRHTD